MARFTTAGGEGSGAPGPQGPAGADGQDALWNFVGEYDNGADYNIGDLVTYFGSTYYRLLGPNTGYAPTDTDYWQVIAAGVEGGTADIADFIFTSVPEDGGDVLSHSSITLPGDKEMQIIAGADSDLYLTAGDDLYVTALGDDIHIRASDEIRFVANYETETPYYWRMNDNGDFSIPGGITNSSENNTLLIYSESSPIVLDGDGGEFLGESAPQNQIATIGDINNLASGEQGFTVNGGTLETQPTFDGAPLFSGTYVKTGPMVHFQVQVDMNNILTFGTGQYFIDLPFPAKYGYQFKEGCLHDISSGKQYAIGGHVYAGQSQMALTFTNSAGQDEAFDFNSPVTLNVADNFHISGTYITN
jgi:hypothetical protein